MVPIGGGGVVPYDLVRPATSVDVDFNPTLKVIDLDDTPPKTKQKTTGNKHIGHALDFFCRLSSVFQHARPEQQPEYVDDCLVQALWNLGYKVKRESGPHWALVDGNRILLEFNKKLQVVLDTNGWDLARST